MERSAKRAFTQETSDRRRPRSITGVQAREAVDHSAQVVGQPSLTWGAASRQAASEIFASYCEEVSLLVDLKTVSLVLMRDGVSTVMGWRRPTATLDDEVVAEDEVLAQFEAYRRERPIDQKEYATYLSLTPPSTGMMRVETMRPRTASNENLLRYMTVRLSIELDRRDLLS